MPSDDLPAISIIIPVYNTLTYLEGCLNSVLKQTLKNIEIICIDNGSTDGSQIILNDYSRRYKNIRVLDGSKKKGPGGARNLGLDHARGEYIGFVDSDDFVDEIMFERLYSCAKDSASDIAICNVISFNDQNGESKSIYYVKKSPNKYEIVNLEDEPRLLNNTTSWNKIYSTNLINKLNLRFPEGCLQEDYYFVIIALIYSIKIALLPETYYHYRKSRKGSNTTERGDSNFHIFEIMKSMNSFISTHPISSLRQNLINESQIIKLIKLYHSSPGNYQKCYWNEIHKKFHLIPQPPHYRLLRTNEQREYKFILKSNHLIYQIFIFMRSTYGSIKTLLGLKNQ